MYLKEIIRLLHTCPIEQKKDLSLPATDLAITVWNQDAKAWLDRWVSEYNRACNAQDTGRSCPEVMQYIADLKVSDADIILSDGMRRLTQIERLDPDPDDQLILSWAYLKFRLRAINYQRGVRRVLNVHLKS